MSAAGTVAEAETTSEPYRRYVLALLLMVMTVNYVDRQIVAILLPAIKRDLMLSDSQLGFISGLAFALFYVALGIPMGRIADRVNRRTLISVCLAAWSVLTALCGLAQNFAQLAAARIGVAIGEAGCTPCAHSLLADYFPPQRRAFAMAVYSSGIAIGVLLGFLAGAWISEAFSWRVALLVVGAPGILLALLVRTTLREPQRGAADARTDSGISPSFGETVAFLWSRRSYRHFVAASALTQSVYMAIVLWVPSYLDRSFGMTATEIAAWLGPILGVAGGAGTLVGGRIGDRLAGEDVRWYMQMPAIGLAIAVPFIVGVFQVHSGAAAALLLAVPVFLLPLHLGPIGAVIQGIAALRMRAQAVAISIFLTNIVGLGIAPQLVGLLSDALAPAYGTGSLRLALLVVTISSAIWGVMHYWVGARSLEQDLRVVRR